MSLDWADPAEPTQWSHHRRALHPQGTVWTTLTAAGAAAVSGP
ncbi:hypothetical protein [Streptomyces lavendulae]